MINIEALIQSIIAFSMPILFAMLGETFAERSGVVNLGIDGIMSMSASAAFIVTVYTNNIAIGLALGVVIGLVFGIIVGMLVIDLQLNQTIVGIAIWILGLGASSFLVLNLIYFRLGVVYIDVLQPKAIPLISSIPIIGGFARQTELVYFAYVLIFLSYFVLQKTSLGLRISATGENAIGADIVGINVRRIRYVCVVISGVLAGVGGAYIPLVMSGSYFANITAGSGWIAIALVRAGSWNPLLGAIGTIVFGAVTHLQFTLQVTNTPMPNEFFLCLPYIVGIISLVIFRTARKKPKCLGVPYERESVARKQKLDKK